MSKAFENPLHSTSHSPRLFQNEGSAGEDFTRTEVEELWWTPDRLILEWGK